MNINEIKKDLYKSKANAYFQRYDGTKGRLIYTVKLFNEVYQFPIDAFQKTPAITTPTGKEPFEDFILTPADDLKGANFEKEIKASLLIRWIEKALNSNNLICLSNNYIPENGGMAEG